MTGQSVNHDDGTKVVTGYQMAVDGLLREFARGGGVDIVDRSFVRDIMQRIALEPEGEIVNANVSVVSKTMWRLVLKLAAGVLVLVGAGFSFYLFNSNAAVLTDVSGDVYVRSIFGTSRAGSGKRLYSGNQLFCLKDNSTAVITYRDGSSLEAGPGTQLGLSTVRGQYKAHLSYGSLSADIKKQQQDRPFIISTPSAVMTILGTKLNVSVKKDSTTLAVASGVVRLTRISDGKSVEVPAGQRATVAEGVEFVPENGLWSDRFKGGRRSGTPSGSNIDIKNIKLLPGEHPDSKYVQCDISWDNSWRASWLETNVTPNITITNWDAAWIFVKYRVAGGPWRHASLSTTNSDHAVPEGATIKVGLSTNASGRNFGCGVFLYRSNEGSGSWTNTIKLYWNAAQDGVANTAKMEVRVIAIGMVYVPQGIFYVGDGTSTDVQGQFCSNTTGAKAFQITSEESITLGGGRPGSLGNNNATGMYKADDFNNSTSQILPAIFPKGHNSFYCMKYEITQGQWTDFFNLLTEPQKTNRNISWGCLDRMDKKGINIKINGNTFVWTAGSDATCKTPHRACNFLSWDDGAAYADWAGMRPMTELEFEKACRGPLMPVPDECAWGNRILNQTTTVTSGGSGSDTANGNCCYGDSVNVQEPVSAGIYATEVSTRITSGATYWGIMEMSGNLWERTVTVGNTAGRLFTGGNGDGMLDSSGSAHYGTWPDTTTVGAGFRGGNWRNSSDCVRVSDRKYAANNFIHRLDNYGFRGIRLAPPED